MKRIFSAFLAFAFVLSGCSPSTSQSRKQSDLFDSESLRGEIDSPLPVSGRMAKNRSSGKVEKTEVVDKVSGKDRFQEINPRAEINRASKGLKPLSAQVLKSGQFRKNSSQYALNKLGSQEAQNKIGTPRYKAKLAEATEAHNIVNKQKMDQAKNQISKKKSDKASGRRSTALWQSLRDPLPKGADDPKEFARLRKESAKSFRSLRTDAEIRRSAKIANERYSSLGEKPKNRSGNSKAVQKSSVPKVPNGLSTFKSLSQSKERQAAVSRIKEKLNQNPANRGVVKKGDFKPSDRPVFQGFKGRVQSLFGTKSKSDKAAKGGFDDFYEPNNSISSAYPIYSYENTFLTEILGEGIAYDDDYYEIYVDPSYRDVTVELYAASGGFCGDVDMRLYDEFGYQMAGSSGGSCRETIRAELNEGGYYYVKVFPFSSSSEGSEYDMIYVTDFTGGGPIADPYEPNDSRSSVFAGHPADLSLYEGVPLTSILGYGVAEDSFDDDYFRIQVLPGYLDIDVDLYHLHAFGDLELRLYNSSGSQIASATSSTDNEHISVLVSSPGTYYIQVDGAFGSDYQEYDLQWTSYSTGPVYTEDNYEPNDTRSASSAGSNSDLSAFEGLALSEIDGLGSQADDDYFRIDVADPGFQRIYINATFFHSEGDIDIRLYNASGTQVAQSAGVSDSEAIDYLAPSTGVYYVRVFGPNRGNYYDMVWFTSFSGYLEDLYEQNDSLATAYDLRSDEGQWLSNVEGLGTQSDVDYYKIQVDQDYQRLIVDLRYTHELGNIDLEVRNSSDQVVATSAGNVDDEYIDIDVPADGIYYIRVTGASVGNVYDLQWSTSRAAFLDLPNLGMTGAWYDPFTSGQGMFIDMVQRVQGADEVIIGWYTYDPTVAPLDYANSRQHWYVIQGAITGVVNRLIIYETSNGVFGERPYNVINTPVGTVDLTFHSCFSASFAYTLTDSDGNEHTDVIPLTRLSPAKYSSLGTDLCTLQTSVNAPAFPMNGVQIGHTGPWYEPATSGQGTFTDYIQAADPFMIAAMYTYDPNDPTFFGNGGQFLDQRSKWVISDGPILTTSNAVQLEYYDTINHFFDYPTPPNYQLRPYGFGTFAFTSCTRGESTLNFCKTIDANGGSITCDPTTEFNATEVFDMYRLTPVHIFQELDGFADPLCRDPI